jgi:hypothetical protein
MHAVKKDGKEIRFVTSAANVGDALVGAGLISGDQSTYGLYVKFVNGVEADYDKDQSYWAFYINGQYAMTGVDSTPITDGETYSFVRSPAETVPELSVTAEPYKENSGGGINVVTSAPFDLKTEPKVTDITSSAISVNIQTTVIPVTSEPVPAIEPPVSVTSNEIVKLVPDKYGNITVVNRDTIEKNAFNAVKGKANVLRSDIIKDRAVQSRIYFNIENMSKVNKEIKLAVEMNPKKETEEIRKLKFKSPYVIKFSQANFGVNTDVAVKADLKGLDKDKLLFFRYADGKTAEIAKPEYYTDKNGYLHFKTTGGTIFVTSK